MCNQCIDCFFYLEQYPDDGSVELCILNPDKPVEINYSDPACPHFELSDSATKERRKGTRRTVNIMISTLNTDI